jgi:hypothetical protein
MPELPDTGTFAAASSHITPDDVAEEVSLGPSPEAHLKAIREYIDAGFDHLILTQIGPEQDPFFEFFERELRHTPFVVESPKTPVAVFRHPVASGLWQLSADRRVGFGR